MNIWIVWLLFLAVSIILLVLTDVLKKRSQQRLLGIITLVPLLASSALTFLLPIEYWEIIFLLVGQLFLCAIVFRLLLSSRLRGPHSTAKDAGQLGLIMAVSVGFVFLPQEILLGVLLATIFIVVVAMALQLRDGYHKYLIEKQLPQNIDDLPTVSVCIPARNENHALADCLTTVLESDYPKLEVIVLDDCSQDKTSRIIHSFAHAGVRFVQGEAPSDGWLGRNQAMQVLSKEATGKYLLFMCVDTRLNSNAISQLVEYAREKHLSMLSVLPRKDGRFAPDTFLSTLRFFWQLTTPRFVDMPVTSALWLVQARALEKAGGLKQVASHIEPERTFARIFAAKSTYRFLIGGQSLGVFYAKKWSSQIETSVRIWYPLLDMQPGRVFLAVFGQYLFTFLPAVIVVSGIITQHYTWVTLISAIIIALQFIVYAFYVFKTQERGRLLAILCLPIVALQETSLIVTSFLQYEFGTVNWKGRNVCYPILSSRSWRD